MVNGNGGLPKVVVTSANCNGEVYLHGGHVTSWIPRSGREVLYVSPNSLWQNGRAIRGGVPVCFPWFGDKADDPKAPAHGFVRTKMWELQGIETIGNDVAVSLSTKADADSRSWWPHEFGLVCRATFGSNLRIELIVSNEDATQFAFEEALHAYFRVGDVEAVAIQGLDETRYIDKVDHRIEKTQSGELRISAETDRVYLATQHKIEAVDSASHCRIVIEKQASDSTVVWNPWEQKSATMSDLGAGEWKNFVCVETSNVGTSTVQLASGQRHSMAAVIHIEP